MNKELIEALNVLEKEKDIALGEMCEAMITFGHYAQSFYGDRCVGREEGYQLITDSLGNSYEFMSIEGVTTDDVRSSITGFSGLQTTLPSSPASVAAAYSQPMRRRQRTAPAWKGVPVRQRLNTSAA